MEGDTLVKQFLDEWHSPELYVIAHTSGSTGAPKPIRLLKDDMRRSARRTNAFFNIGPDSLLACCLSPRFIAGKMMIVRALEAGCRYLMLEPSLTPAIPPAVDLLAIVPAQLDHVLYSPNQPRNIIVGGAPLTIEQERAAHLKSQISNLKSLEIWATYGMTETCSHVALRSVTRGERLFTALPGVELSIDSRGCLVIDGMVTNDVVDLQGNRFEWLGRADNVVNSGGIKLHPESLEQQLRQAGATGLFYLIGRPSARWGTELIAVANDATAAASLAAALPALPPHHRPKTTLIQEITLTPNGKILRQLTNRQLTKE